MAHNPVQFQHRISCLSLGCRPRVTMTVMSHLQQSRAGTGDVEPPWLPDGRTRRLPLVGTPRSGDIWACWERSG
jgi:hypothetical protein